MVKHLDSNDLPSLDQLPCQPEILSRWCTVAARMVVADDNRRRLGQDRRAEDLTGMDQTGIHNPNRDDLLVQQMIPGVETEDTEDLLSRIPDLRHGHRRPHDVDVHRKRCAL